MFRRHSLLRIQSVTNAVKAPGIARKSVTRLMVVFESQLSPSLPVATGAILKVRGGCRMESNLNEPMPRSMRSGWVSLSESLVRACAVFLEQNLGYILAANARYFVWQT
jgi:hypothetical protein